MSKDMAPHTTVQIKGTGTYGFNHITTYHFLSYLCGGGGGGVDVGNLYLIIRKLIIRRLCRGGNGTVSYLRVIRECLNTCTVCK
jgi:hypothetical protein